MKLLSTRFFALVVLVVVLVWVVDAAVDYWFFYDEPLRNLILHPGGVEVYMRLMTAAAFVLLGVSTGLLTQRVREEGREKEEALSALAVDVSERVQAEHALQQRERQMARFFLLAPVGFGVARNRMLLEVNDYLCSMVGRSREELVNQSARILYDSDEEFERVARERDLQLAHGDTVLVPTCWKHSEGRLLDVVLHSSPMDKNDLSKGTVFAAQDVTEQTRARRALEEQAMHLRQAQQLAGVGSWTFHLGEGVVRASEEAKRIYGLSGQEWPIPTVQAVPLPQYRPLLDRALEGLVQRGEPYDVIFSIRRPSDGEIRLIHSMAQYDARGNRVTGVLQDITDRHYADEALRNSEERFRSVIEQSTQGIYVLVGDTFELVNPRFCDMTGVTPEEARSPNFNFRDLLAPESLALVEERRASRLRGEEISESYEFTLKHRSGRLVHVAASVTPIRYRGRDAVLGFLHDITEQKALEARLDQALRMESIGRLSGGVAHDLNNLLSPILGYSELMLQDLPEGDEHKESADAIHQAAIRARDLVKQLLAFSRQQPLEMEVLDANDLLRAFDKLLRRTLREDVRIDMHLSPDVRPISGDRRQLEQVVMNLAVNAQDAMASGGVLTIDTDLVTLADTFVTTHPGSTPGVFTRISVTDHGEGMDAATRRRIFEPFFTTKGKGKGTGLGLATVYGIIKQHGGYIQVESEPDSGTTFSCYFPVAGGDVPSQDARAGGGARAGGSERILVVEDEDLVRSMVTNALAREGYSVLQADSAEGALALLGEGSDGIDLLVTDVVLPGMNGRELHQEIEARAPGTRVLYISGYAGDVITERGVLTDDTFMQKPFSVEALTSRVRALLDTGEAPGGTSRPGRS